MRLGFFFLPNERSARGAARCGHVPSLKSAIHFVVIGGVGNRGHCRMPLKGAQRFVFAPEEGRHRVEQAIVSEHQ